MTVGHTGRVRSIPQLKPERVDEYVAAHEHVWPEMTVTDVNPRWQTGMADYFQNPAGARPVEAMTPLTEYVRLD